VRLLTILMALVLLAGLGVWVWTNAFRPPPAAERLAGVDVAIAGYTIDDLPEGRHRLNLQVTINSLADIDECLGFTLDQTFATRRVETANGVCARPRAGAQTVRLAFDQLSEDDLTFPSHTLVWGIPGGRCGPILLLFGVCVVEQAGTADLELPDRNPLPTFGPFGSLGPLFSFPQFSFEP
jgi:hypothetical protein